MKAVIVTAFALVAALALPSSVRAEDSLAAVKDLYAAAEYEGALGMLERLGGSNPKIEHARYQVFCLLALDRTSEAEKVIERILELDPLFAPDGDEASPRVRELFDRVRSQMAPQIARALYTDGKAALEREDSAAAVDKFELLLKVVDRTGAPEDSLLGELKLLAAGFVDLARSAAAPAAASKPPTAAPGAAAPAAAAPAPAAFTPATPITEKFPPWNPSEYGRGREFRGVIRVRITAEGGVEGVEIVKPIHPAYDWRLLDAAQRWRYEPARRQGTPIESERLVAVHLKQQ